MEMLVSIVIKFYMATIANIVFIYKENFIYSVDKLLSNYYHY